MKTILAVAVLAASFSAFAGDRGDAVERIPAQNYKYNTKTVTKCYKTAGQPEYCYTVTEKRNYKAGAPNLDNVSGGR